MALVTQEIPKVGLVMEAVRVTRWLKNVGDTVRLGEPLVEVETEKSVVEIEATVSGRLVEILVHVGEEASVGNQIARLESDAPHSKRTLPIAYGVRQSRASLQASMASISAASRDLARADEFSSRM